MSSETDYLNRMLSEPSALSMTFTTTQRPRQRPGPQARCEPGLAGFGWSNLGSRTRDPNGKATSLVFTATVWFSDRVVNRSLSPLKWQQCLTRPGLRADQMR
jgi:hypothetical protein